MNGITLLDLPFSIHFILEKLKNPLCSYENLQNYNCEEICKGVGYFSRIIRVKFCWKNEEIEPKSVVLKIPIAEGEECISHLEFAFQREINFYDVFAKDLLDLKIPQVFYGYPYSRNHTKGISIQEDLSEKASTARMLPGLTHEQMEAIIDELAKIHVHSWKSAFWHEHFIEDDNQDLFMKDMYKEAQALVKIQDEPFEDILERAKGFYTYDTYKKVNYTKEKYGFPPTMVHGDLWAANVMFAKDKSGNLTSELVAIIDWQDAHPGNPCEDFGRLLAANTSAEYRRKNTKRLLEFYMERIKFYNNGTAPFDFDQLLDAYKGCLPYTFCYFSFGVDYYLNQPHVVDGTYPGEYKKELVNRAKSFFEDVLEEYEL